jgi:hypothetical protein
MKEHQEVGGRHNVAGGEYGEEQEGPLDQVHS